MQSKRLKCLNCDRITENKYCSYCGQETETHRLTPKHFFFHDIVHGVWHLDKGILYTLKQAVTRPGGASLDYIHGRRVAFYNIFYLGLILIGINLFLNHLYHENIEVTITANNSFKLFINRYIKLLIFMVVPILAVNSFFIFKKMNLNIAEHSITAGLALLLMLLGSIIVQLFNFLEFAPSFSKVSLYSYNIFQIILFLIPTYVYVGFAKNYYSIGNLIFKIVIFNLVIIVELILLMLIVAKAFPLVK